MQGALILTVGSLVSRAFGLVYRIVLPWLMGGGLQAQTGMGLFGMAYPVYTIILSISAAGVPLAISKMVSERYAAGDRTSILRILKLSLLLLAGIGLLAGLLLFLAAPFLASNIMKDPRAALSIGAIAPAVFFVSLMSAYRGFFQGLQDMIPHASSQVIEQTVRVATMFLFAYLLLPYGVEYAAAGATFGAVTGAVGGLVYLILIYRRRSESLLDHLPPGLPDGAEQASTRRILRTILQLAIPISLSSMILPLMNLIDAAVVPSRLHAAGVEDATALFGVLTGFAMPFVVLPTVFTAALSMSLVPSISEAYALRKQELVELRTRAGIRAAVLSGLPASAGLIVLSTALPTLLYDTPSAGPPLAILAAGLVFISVQQTTSGILQGLGFPNLPMRNLLIGTLLKLVLTWNLTALPEWNIKGAALATSCGFLAACLLNVWEVSRRVNLNRVLSTFSKPLLSVGIMAGAAYWVLDFVSSQAGLLLGILFSVAAGVVVYAVLLWLLRAIEQEELDMILPKRFRSGVSRRYSLKGR